MIGFELINFELIEKYVTFLIAVLAFILTFYTIIRDNKSRRYDMLQRSFDSITSINIKIAETSSLKKKDKITQLTMLKTDMINQYSYFAFLVNEGQVSETHAYKLGHKFILRIFDEFSSRNLINEDDHEEIYRLARRWKNYPPTNLCNRLLAKLKRY